jgi:hypothetical protein
MLICQEASPFGLCLTLGFQWRLVIQDFFRARHVATLAGLEGNRESLTALEND